VSARALEIGTGVVVAAALAASLPFAITRPESEDLHLDAGAAHAIADAPPSFPLAEPASLRARVSTRTLGAAPGLVLRSHRVTYGARWEREVTSAAYVGPFDREGDAWPCGVVIHAGAALFDTTGDGSALVDAVDAEVRERFPMSVEGIAFPAVSRTALEVTPIAGGLRVKVDVGLVDGSHFTVPLRLALLTDEGVLRLERVDALPPSWSGPTRAAAARKGYIHWLLGPINDVTMGIADRVAERLYRREIAGIVAKALGLLDRAIAGTQRGLSPFPGRASDRIELRLSHDPVVDETGITMTLCPIVRLAAPKVDASIPGPPRLATPPPEEGALVDEQDAHGGRLSARLSGDALNELLYVLFQTGALRDAGTSEAALRALPDRVADLAFPVRGFDPRLPPVARIDHGALSLIVGDVALGRWDDRDVVGHGAFDLAIAADGRVLRATATPRAIAIDCVTSRGAGVRIDPCLSDLLPALRGELEGKARTWTFGAEVAATSVPLGPVRLELSQLRARTIDAGISLVASARLVRVSP
jgi:hypothetical protein